MAARRCEEVAELVEGEWGFDGGFCCGGVAGHAFGFVGDGLRTVSQGVDLAAALFFGTPFVERSVDAAEDGFERSYVLRVEGRYEHLSPEEAGEVVASSNLGAPDMALASKGSGRDLVLSARVPGAGDARLTIVDIGGRKVTEWDRVPSTGGEFRVADRTPLEPGVYFARLTWEAADHNRMEQRAIKVVVVQ